MYFAKWTVLWSVKYLVTRIYVGRISVQILRNHLKGTVSTYRTFSKSSLHLKSIMYRSRKIDLFTNGIPCDVIGIDFMGRYL